MIERIKIADIVEDGDLYPRGRVDGHTVGRYETALRAGAEFPRPVVARGSRILVDGYHRTRAMARVLGEGAEIEVDLVEYPSRREMILDMIARNARHGRPFDAHDHARIMLIGRRNRLSKDAIAAALGLDPGWIAAKTARRTARAPGGEEIALKRTMEFLAGATLTPEQTACNEGSGGMPLRYFADQVRRHIEAQAVDYTHAATVEALRRLRDALIPLDLEVDVPEGVA